jgi:WD40 repeat protein
VLAGIAVVSAAVTAYALVQRSAADREARETRARELASQAQRAIEEDPERAIMLALAAGDETSEPLPEAVSALQTATQSMRLVEVVDGVGGASLEYSPDGSMVAVDVAEGARTVELIDPADGDVLAEVETPYAPGFDGLAFDPGGAELVAAYTGSSGAPAIGRFAVPSGRAAEAFMGPAGSYEQISYHPDGHWLGAVRRYGDPAETEILVWAVDSPAAPISLGPGPAFGFLLGTTSVAIAGDEQGSLRVVDIETGDMVTSIEIPGVEVDSMAVDPTGDRVALRSRGTGQIVVLDLNRGEQVVTLDVTGAQSVEFSPDGRWLASGSFDNLVHLFETENLAETSLAGSPTLVGEVAFAPDSSRLASISAGQLRIWELGPDSHPALANFHASGPVSELVVGEGESTAIATIQSPDASVAVERIDLATGEGVEVADGLHFQPFNMGPLISADLHVAAGLDHELNTHVINLDSGADVELERCDVVRALDHSARLALIDGEILCAPEGGQVLPGPGVRSRVADLRTGRTVLDLGARDMWSGVFGPPTADGLPGLVAVLGSDGTVVVYRLPDGERVGSYTSGDGFPLAAAFTADGRRLAVTKDDGQLAMIDLARLADDPADAEVWTKAAHTGSVATVETSASGLIATTSFTGNVRLWSPDGAMIADLPVQLVDGAALAFAPGTDTLYYEDAGGVIRRFTPDTDELTALARSMLTREFTADECARYFPGEDCPVFAE